MSPTLPTRESLLAFLDSLGIAYQEERHAAVFTMNESAGLSHTLDGCRCKNLFVRDKKASVRLLVVTPPDCAVDLGALGRELGLGRLSLCSREEVADLLGVEAGAVSPFALLADRHAKRIRLLFDLELRSIPKFLFHPLVNTASVSIDSDSLVRFLEAIEHPLEFVGVPRRTAQNS